MKQSIQTIPFFNGTIKLVQSIDGTCRQCVLQKYCGEKPITPINDDINCMSADTDNIYVWATKPTKYQLFRYTIAKSILDGRPLGTIVVKWWTGTIYKITNIELKTKWSRPYFIVTYKCKENGKYVEKKEAFNKYGCSKYGYSQLMLHLTFLHMYYVYRISTRSTIASFPDLNDAINYSEQVLHLTESEYQILKQIL